MTSIAVEWNREGVMFPNPLSYNHLIRLVAIGPAEALQRFWEALTELVKPPGAAGTVGELHSLLNDHRDPRRGATMEFLLREKVEFEPQRDEQRVDTVVGGSLVDLARAGHKTDRQGSRSPVV